MSRELLDEWLVESSCLSYAMCAAQSEVFWNATKVVLRYGVLALNRRVVEDHLGGEQVQCKACS